MEMVTMLDVLMSSYGFEWMCVESVVVRERKKQRNRRECDFSTQARRHGLRYRGCIDMQECKSTKLQS